MMMKVLLYSYWPNVDSCRKIAKAFAQNIILCTFRAILHLIFEPLTTFKVKYLKTI